MKNAIFCDFDGTISRRDVGYHLFHHFSGGKNDELIPDWKSGRITSRQCLTREAAMIRATSAELESYLQQHCLDPTFKAFADNCRESGVGMTILSDGLDFYIERLLNRENIEGLEWKSNHAELEGDKMTVSFPYENGSCRRCGNCKGERIREFRANGNGECRIIFVGDGYSDECATLEADLIFAKKDLEQLCLRNNIEYIAFDNFEDVTFRLRELGVLFTE